MGIFNAILAPDLDKPSPPKHFSTELIAWARAMGVEEIWRWKHPNDRSHSCFSTTYKMASQIDLAFANPTLISDVLDAA